LTDYALEVKLIGLSHASGGQAVLAMFHALVRLKQVSRVKNPSAEAAAMLFWSFRACGCSRHALSLVVTPY